VLDLDLAKAVSLVIDAFARDPRWSAGQSLMRRSAKRHGQLRQTFFDHGYVKTDSHVDIPVDKRSLKAIPDRRLSAL
jgi:beta-N-acetylhexosaminidase